MSRKMKLDFTGVESFQTASEGVHACKIASADEKQSSGGNDMIVVAFEVIKGVDKGARVYENFPLVDKALWKLKGLLQAIGMKADGKVQLDLDKLVGKTCNVTVKHEEYEGKTRARVDSMSRLILEDAEEDADDEDFEEEEEQEEEEKPAKKSKLTQKKAEPEEEEDDDDWDEDEEEEEPAPKKKAKKEDKPEKKSDKKAAKKSDDEDDDWDDDDWDEED